MEEWAKSLRSRAGEESCETLPSAMTGLSHTQTHSSWATYITSAWGSSQLKLPQWLGRWALGPTPSWGATSIYLWLLWEGQQLFFQDIAIGRLLVPHGWHYTHAHTYGQHWLDSVGYKKEWMLLIGIWVHLFSCLGFAVEEGYIPKESSHDSNARGCFCWHFYRHWVPNSRELTVWEPVLYYWQACLCQHGSEMVQIISILS